MQNLKPALIILCMLSVACTAKVGTDDTGVSFVDTTKPFKKEIPQYNGKFDLFYILAKTKQKQLRLDSLEHGFDNLQIRVWYDFSFSRQSPLVIITNKNLRWTATVYTIRFKWDGKTVTILSTKVRNVKPKSGWKNFSRRLLDLKITTLPDTNDIPDYGTGADGNSFWVEVETKNQYRFYGYWEPEYFGKKLWQAKNMADILKLFKDELGVAYSTHFKKGWMVY